MSETKSRNELPQALLELQPISEVFSQNGVELPALNVVEVPTWRGGFASGLVYEIALLPGLKAFVGVKTPAVATDTGEERHAHKTRFGVWVWEYSGQIPGKSVIAVDCIIHEEDRVWWSAAHVGNGRSRLIDDLCARLKLDRVKPRSKGIDRAAAFGEICHIAQWVHDTAQLIAGLGPDHESHRKRR